MLIDKYKESVLTCFKHTKSDIIVESTAGSGKTKMIELLSKNLNFFDKSLFLSFSKLIVDELKERFANTNIKCATLHSLGYEILRNKRNYLLDDNKYFKKAMDVLKIKKINKDNYSTLMTIVEFWSFTRIYYLGEVTKESIKKFEENSFLKINEEIVEVIFIFKKEINYTSIDFTDMIYRPFVDGFFPKYKNIMLDEAQDLNNLQYNFLLKLIEKGNSRFVGVGDSFQSIYGFIGSNSIYFNLLKERDNTKVFNLPLSYRCPSAIVEVANEINPKMVANKIGGEVVIDRRSEYKFIKEGDLVICRNNAPLIRLYIELIKLGKKSFIVGDFKNDFIFEIINKIKNFNNLKQFKENSNSYINEKKSVLLAKYPSGKTFKYIEDLKIAQECLIELIVYSKINNFDKKELENKIKNIFSENNGGIKMCTIHKAKGLESKNVYFLDEYRDKKLIPSKFAKTFEEVEQENNLLFVAITRAKEKLIYLSIK